MPQHKTMKSNRNVEGEIHVFCTAVLDEDEWLFPPSDSSFCAYVGVCVCLAT
jgi:hypothetical protein